MRSEAAKLRVRDSGSRLSWSTIPWTPPAANTVTASPATPREAANDSHGLVSSASAKQKVYLPGHPSVARSTPPGRPPPTLRTTSCNARPIVALARLPCPIALTPLFMPMRRAMGPSTITSGPANQVVARSPCMLNSVVHTACDGREDDRQVLGAAAREHRVDRDLLHRAVHEVRRHDRDDLVGCPRGALEHPQHPGLGRRHDRQPVGPAAVEERLVLVLQLRQVDATAGQPPGPEPHREAVDLVGVQRAAAAPRPLLGQPLPQRRHAGERLPLRA